MQQAVLGLLTDFSWFIVAFKQQRLVMFIFFELRTIAANIGVVFQLQFTIAVSLIVLQPQAVIITIVVVFLKLQELISLPIVFECQLATVVTVLRAQIIAALRHWCCNKSFAHRKEARERKDNETTRNTHQLLFFSGRTQAVKVARVMWWRCD